MQLNAVLVSADYQRMEERITSSLGYASMNMINSYTSMGEDGGRAAQRWADASAASRRGGSSYNSERDSNNDTCRSCGGTGVSKTPNSGGSLSSWVAHYNSRGNKCLYCGSYTQHFHDKCSSPAFDAKGGKKVDKLVKKGLMTNEQATIFKNNPLGQFNGQGTGGKKSKDVFVGLIDRLTENGQINQEQIITYCKEENISLEDVFPLQYWAKILGEGWFIPGDLELTYIANFYFGGLGKKNSLGIKFQYHAKDLCDNELIQESLFKMVFYGLFSSSCHHADAGFRKLRCEMVKMSGKHWLEIFDSYAGQSPLVCAVHEF